MQSANDSSPNNNSNFNSDLRIEVDDDSGFFGRSEPRSHLSREERPSLQKQLGLQLQLDLDNDSIAGNGGVGGFGQQMPSRRKSKQQHADSETAADQKRLNSLVLDTTGPGLPSLPSRFQQHEASSEPMRLQPRAAQESTESKPNALGLNLALDFNSDSLQKGGAVGGFGQRVTTSRQQQDNTPLTLEIAAARGGGNGGFDSARSSARSSATASARRRSQGLSSARPAAMGLCLDVDQDDSVADSNEETYQLSESGCFKIGEFHVRQSGITSAPGENKASTPSSSSKGSASGKVCRVCFFWCLWFGLLNSLRL